MNPLKRVVARGIGAGIVMAITSAGAGQILTLGDPVQHTGDFGFSPIDLRNVVVEDLTGNGALDVIIANRADSTSFASGVHLRLWPGDGQGGFDDPVDLLSLSQHRELFDVAIADFNNDGHPDVVAMVVERFCDFFEDDGEFFEELLLDFWLVVRLNDGQGGFGPPIWSFSSSDFFASDCSAIFGAPIRMSVGDVNNDGIQDVIVPTGTGRVAVRFGNGAGGFSGGTNSFILAVGTALLDVNHDDSLDFVMTQRSNDLLRVSINDGAGGFTQSTTLPTGSRPTAVATGDLNGDGFDDVVVSNNGTVVGPTSISLYFGSQNGLVGPVNRPLPSNARGSAITDLNGDGAPEIIVANGAGVSVLDSLGFSVLNIGLGGRVGGVGIGDITGNGAPDIVAYDIDSPRFWVIPNETSFPPGSFSIILPIDGAEDVPLEPTLQWSAAPGALFYNVQVSTDPDLQSPIVDELISDTLFTIGGGALAPGVTYHWGVTALNGAGETPSDPVVASFTTEAAIGNPADFNGDGEVNGADLATLLANWGPCENKDACPADLNSDGVVNGADLATLLANWGAVE